MRPDQIADYSVPSDPRMHPDGGRAAFVVARADLDEDRSESRIWLWDGNEARPLTAGPFDSAPRWSPDGKLLAFLRKGPGDDDRPQVAILPLEGGEAAVVTEFALGVQALEWSPDGARLAVIATEWTEEWADLAAERRASRPRRITRIPFRADDRGWVDDRRSHLWIVDPANAQAPRCLTPGDYNEAQPSWSPDGSEIAFLSARHENRGFDPGSQIWTVPAAGGAIEGAVELGAWELPSYDASERLYAVGRPEVWSHPDVPSLHRRDGDGPWTDLTGHLDRSLAPAASTAPAGPQWIADGRAFSILEDEGRLRVVVIDPDGTVSDVIGGDRAVTGVSPRPDGSAAVFVSSTPTDPGEVWWWKGGEERRLTDLNRAFRSETTLVEPQRFVVAHDGVEIEGWVYLPEGDGAVSVLLNIHGGPAVQYGYAFFDEFQIYAGAGYGVVATNPRGSSGYGREHIRAVVGRWHEERPPDLVDLLAAPAAAAAEFPRLDVDRLGVMGGSYGGLATVMVAASDPRYRSAVAERGLYAWPSFAGTSDIGGFFAEAYLGPDQSWEELWQSSVLARADTIKTPTLVVHSESDWRCPIEQAEQLFARLLRNGVETELIRFPSGEGHEMSRSGKPKHRVERFEIILDWHRRYLG